MTLLVVNTDGISVVESEAGVAWKSGVRIHLTLASPREIARHLEGTKICPC